MQTKKITDKLLTVEFKENGLIFKTGVPVIIPYIRSKHSAENFGSKFQQDIEPAGRYVIMNANPGELSSQWVKGTATFKNPLVIAFHSEPEKCERYYDDNSWKKRLSQVFKGKTGKALSLAIVRKGHDAIITVYTHEGKAVYTKEIVDLTMFVNIKTIKEKHDGRKNDNQFRQSSRRRGEGFIR
jgi:hypothetical protein